MRVNFWQMAMLIAWSMLARSAAAQLPPTRDQRDHPSHRYLPPPTGIRTVGEQVRALEQLSAGNGAEGQAPFQLSPTQLKQLDSIVESFRNDQGELELPDPKSIPKQWIDTILPDPKQRQQVKDVLEEYARTRNLQLAPSTNPETPSPFDSPDSQAAGPRSSSPNDARLGGQSSRPGKKDPRPDSGESVNDGASQNRLAELQKLYESLKTIQEQRAQQEQQREAGSRWSRGPAPTNERNRNPSGTDRNDPRRTRPNGASSAGQGTANNNPRDRTDRVPRINQPQNNLNNGQPNRFRPAPQLTDDALADGLLNQPNGVQPNGIGDNANGSTTEGGGGRNVDGADNAASSGKAPASPSADSKAPALTPFDAGYDFSKDQQVLNDPFAQPEDATSAKTSSQSAARPQRPAKAFDVRRLAQEPRAEPQATVPNESGFDLKKSVDQSGLGATLKRLVQKTLKEQGFDPSRPGNLPQSADSTSASAAKANGQPAANDPAGRQGPTAITAEQLKQWANAVAAAPNMSSNTSTAPANSQWGKWAREVWQAVAEAPPRSSSNSSAASAGSAATASSSTGVFGQLPEVRWTNSMTMAVLLIAGLAGLLLWLSRRRVAELADVSAAQAEWVRTVMAQGLKTRADVVRAFHQLVKQSRSVSDWWTHRSIVKHFSSQTPQVATAISELAVVYEQARYYPDDVELSQQQLARVRTLLESVTIPSSNPSK